MTSWTRRDAIGAAAAVVGMGLSGCRGKKGAAAVDPNAPRVVDPKMPFAWQVVSSGERPGLRSRHGLVYDPAAKATVLFGGMVWEGRGTVKSDTWELQNGGWTRIRMGTGPAGRHRGAMVYDTARGTTVLFGGQGSRNEFQNDTWLYSGQRWRQSATGPAPRLGHMMAFDEAAGLTVLFGGVGANMQSLGDTWLFDGSAWHTVRGAVPPARRYAAFAYDPDLNGCVLHGGSDDESGRRGFGDAWLFRDRTWTRLANVFDTEKRDDHGLAYHRGAKKLVMLEGLAGVPGLLVRDEDGWHRVAASPTPRRHQCSPLAWDESLNGLVLHGGEARHGGPQFDTTWVLRFGAGA